MTFGVKPARKGASEHEAPVDSTRSLMCLAARRAVEEKEWRERMGPGEKDVNKGRIYEKEKERKPASHSLFLSSPVR